MAWTRHFPNVHIVADTHMARFLCRTLKNDDVVTYWHIGTRNWLVAIKMDKWGESGLYEFHTLNKDPDGTAGPCMSDDDMESMTRKMFHPDDMGEVMKKAISEENARLLKEQAIDEESMAMRQAWARRHSHKVKTMMDHAWLGTMLTPRR